MTAPRNPEQRARFIRVTASDLDIAPETGRAAADVVGGGAGTRSHGHAGTGRAGQAARCPPRRRLVPARVAGSGHRRRGPVAIAAAIRVAAAGRRSRDLACGCACSPRRGRRGDEGAHRRRPAGGVPADGDRDAGGVGRGCRPTPAGLDPRGPARPRRARSGLGNAALRAGLLAASPVRPVPTGRSDARPMAAGTTVALVTAALVRRLPRSGRTRRSREEDLEFGDRRVRRRAERCASGRRTRAAGAVVDG